jgi:hypothetical protein
VKDSTQVDVWAEELVVGAMLNGASSPRLRLDHFREWRGAVYRAICARRSAGTCFSLSDIAEEAEVAPIILAELAEGANEVCGLYLVELVSRLEHAAYRRRSFVAAAALALLANEADWWRFDGCFAEIEPAVRHIEQALGNGAAQYPAIDAGIRERRRHVTTPPNAAKVRALASGQP